MKVKKLKSMINKLPDDADIKICYYFKDRGCLKEIDNVTTVIDQDTNQGFFVINTYNYMK